MTEAARGRQARSSAGSGSRQRRTTQPSGNPARATPRVPGGRAAAGRPQRARPTATRSGGPAPTETTRTQRRTTAGPPRRPDRRSQRRPQRRPRRRLQRRSQSTLLPVLWAAVSPALAGLAIIAAAVLVVWGADSRSTTSTGQAFRVAVQVWLLGHHGTLHLPGGDVGMLPLGLTLLPGVLLLRSGTSLARASRIRDLPGAGRATAGLAGGYAVLVTTTTAFAGTDELSVSAPQTLVGAALLAGVAGGLGVIRGAGLGRKAFRVLPVHARLVVRAAGVALGVLLASGALLAGVAFAADLSRARELSQALGPGTVSGTALLLLGVLYAPNAAVWGAAYAVGPGFAVGTGTSVSAFGVTLGPVPAFPLLAALPEGDRAAPATWIFLAAPVAAGVTAGVLVTRRLATGDYGVHRPGAAGLWAGMSGAAAGVVFGVVAALSGGPLGSGRLAALGPSPWQVGLAAAAGIGLAAGLAATVLHWHAVRTAGVASD